MKHRIFVIGPALSAFALIAGLGAPVSAADKETRQMMADIRMLQEQTQQVQTLVGSLTEVVAAAVKAVNARIDARIDEQAGNTNKAFANQKLSIDAITHDLGTLREKVDENNVRVGTLMQEIDALRQLVTQLNVARSPVDPVLGPADGAPADSAAVPPPAAGALGMSPAAAWQLAYGDYTSGQYDIAVQGFEAYVKSFPTGVQADDAQVYVCRSYLQMANYQKAVETCDLAIRNYPTGDRLAEAYYVKGLAFKNLKRTDDARAAFEYLVKAFPNSDEANLAATQLSGMPAARRP